MKTIEQLFEEVFTMDSVMVDLDTYWDIEDIIGQEICSVFEKGSVDDLTLSAFASNTHGDTRIHGQFRVCVHGGMKYEDMKQRLESMRSKVLIVSELYHPEPTPGISFNGVYEDEDTTYIGGWYELRGARK